MGFQQTFKALLGFLKETSVYVIKDELTTYTVRRKMHKMYTKFFCQKWSDPGSDPECTQFSVKKGLDPVSDPDLDQEKKWRTRRDPNAQHWTL